MAARTCEHCGAPIAPKTKWGRFCGTRCRFENWLDERAIERLPRLMKEGRVRITAEKSDPTEAVS